MNVFLDPMSLLLLFLHLLIVVAAKAADLITCISFEAAVASASAPAAGKGVCVFLDPSPMLLLFLHLLIVPHDP